MDHFLDLFQNAFKMSLISIGLPLLCIFILGFMLAVIQAATQVQDQVISFFPKIGLCFLLIFIFGSIFVEMLSEMLRESITQSVHVE